MPDQQPVLPISSLTKHHGGVEAVDRFAMFDRIRHASGLAQPGESAAHGNTMFCQGMILN